MDTHSCKSVLIDLFNLPPLPNEWNKEESYMDVPYNYYIPNWEEFQTAGQNRQGRV